MTKLSLKQKAFADNYIECSNATEAALKAGYSKKTARTIASENLTKPNIKEYIENRLKVLEDEKIATQTEILRYFTAVMRGDEKDQFGLAASLRDRTDAAKELAKIMLMYNKKPDDKEDDDGVEIIV